MVLCRIPTLRYISIDDNELTTLPDCLANLHQLVRLTLPMNQFQVLPASVVQLMRDRTLTAVRLEDNPWNQTWAEIEALTGTKCGPGLHSLPVSFAVLGAEIA